MDNLNFGNPEKPEVMWQFTEAIEGMSQACDALGIPVVGGNVSFYNETDDVDILPSPVAGMLGFCDPMPARAPRLDRAEDGMEVWLIGADATGDFAASAYARVVLGHEDGRPAAPNDGLGLRVVSAAADLAHRGVPVLHDVSHGGVAVALAEICIKSDIGASIAVGSSADLFDESPHRFLAVVPASFEMSTARRPQTRDRPSRWRPNRLRPARVGVSG